MNYITVMFTSAMVWVLAGCTLVRSDVPAQPKQVAVAKSVLMPHIVVPGLAPVPDINTFVNGNGVLDADELDAYYKALDGYNTYLASYMDYLSKQYKLGYKRKLDCFSVAKAPKIPIPDNPSVLGVSEDHIPDVLVDHIEKLRDLMRKHNEIIDKQNHMIDLFCS